MKKIKKREFTSSELVKQFAAAHGFQEKLLALQVEDFLRDYLDQMLYQEITSVQLNHKILTINITSALLKNDFQMRKSFYLQKFQEQFGVDVITGIIIR